MAAAPEAFEASTYKAVSSALTRLGEARHTILAMLVALAPFDARDLPGRDGEAPANTKTSGLRSGILSAVDQVIDDVLDSIESTARPLSPAHHLQDLVPAVPTIAPPDRGTALAVTFGMSTVPVDRDGAFSASRVFEAHKYANGPLLAYLLTHMQALGLEPSDDMLAMIHISGWIVLAPDSVLAWQTLRSTVLRLQAAADSRTPSDGTTETQHGSDVLDDVLAHLSSREEALRQSRVRIQAALRGLEHVEDAEEHAHTLADVYRRLVEGPLRHYGWAMRCLALGFWTKPPPVGAIGAGLAIDPWLQAALLPKLLPDIRNGQAHEGLEWDGHRGVYTVDGTDIDLTRVDIAVADILSFALGCEAALAHWHARAAAPGDIFPTTGQSGRMAGWRRTEALFGTNGLRLTGFKFNALRVQAYVERLDREDINPALQALVHARQLLPTAESFAYFIEDSETSAPLIEVDAAALDATHPVWLHARQQFDAMPLATFLPANLNARLRHESEPVAARAVAWIALDDALSSIDSSPSMWDVEHLRLAHSGVGLALLALDQSTSQIPEQQPLRTAIAVLDAVRISLDTLRPPFSSEELDEQESLKRLRSLWTSWGPVPRLPGGLDSARGDDNPGYHSLPRDHTISADQRWSSM